MEVQKKNILILSCGTRNKVVEAFRNLPDVGTVLCTDSSPYAPALYEADKAMVVPRITADNYLETILDICASYKVDGLLSLIDPELSLLARHKDKFLQLSCTPMISDADAIENCFDKFEFYKTLQANHIPTVPSYGSVSEAKEALLDGSLDFPLMVKPAKGSASIGLHKVETLDELDHFADIREALIIQQWIPYQEYGVDCYVDMLTGRLSQMFIKKKIKMRAGETDKAVSVHDGLIRDTILHFFSRYPYSFYGTIDFDVFCNGSECLISEINPRFGGGYPHAYACGLNYPQYYMHNLNDRTNPPFTDLQYDTGVVMMKYNEIMIRREGELAGWTSVK